MCALRSATARGSCSCLALQSEIIDKYANVIEAVRKAKSNRLNGLRRASSDGWRMELVEAEKATTGIIAAIEDGLYQPSMKSRMKEARSASHGKAPKRNTLAPRGRPFRWLRGRATTSNCSVKRVSSSRRADPGAQPSSGDPKPSRDDIEMTKEIAKAAEALGIAIHDHLVIGRKGHANFRSLGLL